MSCSPPPIRARGFVRDEDRANMERLMRFSFGLFSTIFTALISLGHLYVYRRLFRDTGAPRALRIAGSVLLVLLGPGFIVVRQLFWPLPWPWGGIVTAAQWTWIVAALYLFGTLLAADVAKLALRRRTPEFSPERRRFLALASAGTASAVTASAVGYGFWRAYEAPVLREVAIRLPKLPRSLDGFSILQLTDIHIGSVIQRRFVEELVSRANATHPDLIAITGDLVDSDPEHIGEAVAALTALRSRHGTYFVTGNHEYHSDDLRWCAVLEGMGLNVLRRRTDCWRDRVCRSASLQWPTAPLAASAGCSRASAGRGFGCTRNEG